MNPYRNQFIYQVFVRNYSNEGTFNALTDDLDRIQALGTDILYLLPIHPIGIQGRKGTYGSPYAIRDYTGISEYLGTLDDFKRLVAETHRPGMRLMLDVVYHHTAPDHPWVKEHPEFYHWKDGHLTNKIGDWTDIADFEFENNPLLIEKLTQALEYWVKLGVDGFRFDVAPMIPEAFYKVAFPRIKALNPNLTLLAESVDPWFLSFLRYNGYTCLSDGEVFRYFDLEYDYDNQEKFLGYLKGESSLEELRNRYRLQEIIYPVNYVKARNVENHDNARIRFYTQSYDKTLNWLGYVFFAKGIAFLHFGVETGTDHLSYLFEKDPVDWTKLDPNLVKWIQGLATMKKDPIFAQNDHYGIHSHKKDVLHFDYENDREIRVGIFNVGDETGVINVKYPEGKYVHCITGAPVEVRHGVVSLSKEPIIFSIPKK
jgi:glycosidase